jgi:hypothetical protein
LFDIFASVQKNELSKEMENEHPMQKMKYKRLTQEQLLSLEKEFVDFLVINGIIADDWSRMKKNEPEKAEQTIELFSDVVFEGILRKTDFIEWRSKTEVRAFHCLKDKIILVGLKAEMDSNINFLDQDFIRKAGEKMNHEIKAYTTEKLYAKNREEEMFEMLENGCVISDGKLFKAIAVSLGSAKY